MYMNQWMSGNFLDFFFKFLKLNIPSGYKFELWLAQTA